MSYFPKLTEDLINKQASIAIVGLGYVGRPLFCALVDAGFSVIGYDINHTTIDSIAKQVPGRFRLSTSPECLADASVVIVTVPTPVFHGTSKVDLGPMIAASKSIGQHAAQTQTVVVYESTAYPGITKEMVKVITDASNGKLEPNRNLKWGYSPERITPGDTLHQLYNTNKIVSGCDEYTAEFVRWLYSKVVTQAELYVAPSVEVAEAAKVLENVQRDVNIALMNDLTPGFHKLGISIREVIKAASTKWNFGNYQPGLVGGHCIAVDPWYLEHKLNTVGCSSGMIHAARKASDNIPKYITDSLLTRLHNDRRASVLQLGLTYKPGVCDWRDSRAIELANNLTQTFSSVVVSDYEIEQAGLTNHRDFAGLTWADATRQPSFKYMDAVILAVPHAAHIAHIKELLNLMPPPVEILDVCGVLNPKEVYKTGHNLWTL